MDGAIARGAVARGATARGATARGMWRRSLVGVVLGCGAAAASAADYVTVVKQVEVDRDADMVWTTVGDYCAIAVWMKTTCEYLSGTGEVGTVRRILNGVTEPMVAKTAYSYTYWQTVGTMAATGLHGTLAVAPAGSGRSRLSYTLFYDQSMLASDEVRAAQRQRLNARFQELLGVMKSMSETKSR
jgi:Polyketide cyclase / dehydrase and lipid transport